MVGKLYLKITKQHIKNGVIYHGNNLVPGVDEFVNWLYENNKSFLFLTNL